MDVAREVSVMTHSLYQQPAQNLPSLQQRKRKDCVLRTRAMWDRCLSISRNHSPPWWKHQLGGLDTISFWVSYFGEWRSSKVRNSQIMVMIVKRIVLINSSMVLYFWMCFREVVVLWNPQSRKYLIHWEGDDVTRCSLVKYLHSDQGRNPSHRLGRGAITQMFGCYSTVDSIRGKDLREGFVTHADASRLFSQSSTNPFWLAILLRGVLGRPFPHDDALRYDPIL